MKRPANQALEQCFESEVAAMSKRHPRIVLTARLRGVERSIDLRMPAAFRDRMKEAAPGCSTTAVVALAQRGLLALLTQKQRLMSQWIPERTTGGRFLHLVLPAIDGQPLVYCGPFDGQVKHSPVSIPGPMLDALSLYTKHRTALVALADWQLDLLTERRERLIFSPGPTVTDSERITSSRRKIRPTRD
jgi:hypothetical protein